AAIGTMLDVNGVVEISRGLPVDGNNRQVAEVFAASTLGFSHGLRATLGFIQNFSGEGMREMMFADDDLGVDAEFARAAENFDDATRWRRASLRKAQQFVVDDG